MPENAAAPAVPSAALPDAAQVQRSTLRVLVLTQALGGVGVTTGITVAALLARDLSGSDALAGTAQTGQVVGSAIAAAGIAAATTRAGRRPGLSAAYLIGALGSTVCVLAAVLRVFPLLLVGTVLVGFASAANIQARYAATDLAEPGHRARALSTVVWATTVGAVLGPNLAGPGERLGAVLHIPGLAGPFVIAAVFLLGAAAVMELRLRPDPMLLAKSLRRAQQAAEGGPEPAATSLRGLVDLILARRGLLAAVTGLALSQAVMVAVMVMTPLHMRDGAATLEVIGLVISGHILGMYAFSPVMGYVADRFGRPALLFAGGVVLLVALLLAGTSVAGWSWSLGLGLFLLGIGWSAGSVAASTLVTDQTPLEYRAQVQGVADVVTWVTAALGGAAAGLIVGSAGYGWLSAVSAVFVLGILAAAEVTRRSLATETHSAESSR
jgi:MFS family permease